MRKKKFVLLLLAVLAMATLSGCFASESNKAQFNGSWVGTTSADYIVVNYSGGVIMDVWKLKDAFVSSPESSDGWIFSDEGSDAIAIGGDAKVIRVKNTKTWDMYYEYHAEFDKVSYFEFIKNK